MNEDAAYACNTESGCKLLVSAWIDLASRFKSRKNLLRREVSVSGRCFPLEALSVEVGKEPRYFTGALRNTEDAGDGAYGL